MKKIIALTVAAVGSVLATGAAHAGNVYWSVGISAPPVATVISNGPVYAAPAPVYMPAPVVYAPPAPVYLQAPVVVPAPVYVRPSPVYYVPPRRVIYRPVPVVREMRPAAIVYGQQWRGHRDEYGTYHDGRWDDGRRYRH